MSPQSVHYWPGLVGRTVEAKLGPAQHITGVVDDAMPDSSLVWLTSSDGVRRILEKRRGHEIFIGKHAAKRVQVVGHRAAAGRS